MNTIRGDETIRELSRAIPRATWVFERYAIDYCCGGDRPLRDVCTKASLPLEEVIEQLERQAAATDEAPPDEADVAALLARIVDGHHAFTREALERAMRLSEKVHRVHGGRHPELGRMRELVVALNADLLPHLAKEETVLFPYLGALGRGQVARPPFGTVKNPVRMMEHEHDAVGVLLRELRDATAGYAPPDDACGSWRALYEVLSDLEKDLHQHIHLENNVLFPKALALEARISSR
jgi:regulator of cell morphogenesis and NO signaling